MKMKFRRVFKAGLVFGAIITSAWLGAGLARAQTSGEITMEHPPFVQAGVPYNHSSQGGFPLSTTANPAVGDNGGAPTSAEQQANGLTTNVPTPGQFQGFVNYGVAAGPSFRGGSLGVQSTDGSVRLAVLEVGSPIVAQQVSFRFGSEIPVPSKDEDDNILASDPHDYWFAEPHTTDDHATARYYYSKHALKVFAVSSGNVDIVWKKITPVTSEPVDYVGNEGIKWHKEGANYFRLHKVTYLVSGGAAQAPQKLYWTEAGYHAPPVNIPSQRVDDVHVVFNNDVPEFVSFEDAQANARATMPVAITNTVFFTRHAGLNQLRAFNRQGRVFVEFLGQNLGVDNRRKHLGIEIVDVFDEPDPADIDIELGERITAYPDGRNDAHLNPEPVVQGNQNPFLFHHLGTGNEAYYAVAETHNENDVLVHWLRPGFVQGIEWPFLYNRYRQFWPTEESKYSHYVRPAATDKDEASQTAVALPPEYATEIAYQDPPPGLLGAYVTADLRFYTYLTSEMPAHRTLLQYSLEQEVGFERVYSRLLASSSVTPPNFAVAPPQEGYPDYDDRDAGNKGEDALSEIRFVHQTVNVGDRILAPTGEEGDAWAQNYLAGYINEAVGDSYNPNAYVNPLANGFEAADQGAIIPVNAIPGANQLEVFWFRSSNLGAARGFRTVFWPSVVGRYTIRWPEKPLEIILASNDGTGPLDSLEALGSIYVQNVADAPGYNPNEEHAIMSGGQAFALRDDLNITDPANYTSDPFVLIEHNGSDGRPDMVAFKVLREKPEENITFDYTREVPLVHQAPMPLPLMDLIVRGEGVTQVDNLSEELVMDPGSGFIDTAAPTFSWGNGVFIIQPASGSTDPFDLNTFYLLAHPSDPLNQLWFYVKNKNAATLEGYLAYQRPFLLDTTKDKQGTNSVVLAGRRSMTLDAGDHVVLLQSQTGLSQVDLVVDEVDPGSGRVTFNGNLNVGSWTEMTHSVVAGPENIVDHWRIYHPDNLDYSPTDSVTNPFTYEDRKGTLWIYRGRHNDSDRLGFGMRYYYKTRESFYFPLTDPQPSVGAIVPYLRAYDEINDEWVGDATGKQGQALPILYRPVWPSNPAQMQRGYTLTTPDQGLPAVRGQSSLRVLYQQSEHQGVADNESVILHDPTREKEIDLAAIPATVRAENFRGLIYFPNLPPHLSERFFYDPNRGAHGKLVLRGDFIEAPLGSDYLLLNALTTMDVDALKALVDDSDTEKQIWHTAIDQLSTTVETFREDLSKPGAFVVDSSKLVGPTELPVIVDSDTAVDSYALSAVGPGSGFVTLIAGNGSAFTPPDEPVSMHVFEVVDDLWRGELKIVESSNPLAEKLTLQQSADLAGKADSYVFDWRIEQPANGVAPTIPYDQWGVLNQADGTRVTLGGQQGILSLVDNYVVSRYRPVGSDPNDPNVWSTWTDPQLAEGWIKRVLGGINPFNQRVTDLFNNTVNTSASILEQAGPRWEGDVALNLDNINDFGLIEIYETILRRGRGLSIDAGINYSPANDALLLAAGYLNDLYMMVGNEALADAANPTIGIAGTDIATAQFSFKGQLASLLDEELALLRGRDDSLQPGVEISPVYNRLVWNFTRGIDSGEVVYANNYNIKENQEDELDGVIDASDAQKMYPQGHGDAYGHFLTALKGYYHLLIDNDFTWVPRAEAVTVLGVPVQVDYSDERKFAAAAAALARAGNQVLDLTWRKDYETGDDIGWEHLGTSRDNDQTGVTRYWGADHWASRTSQGAYLNWVVGNAMLPAIDPNPNHEGIQKIDRTTVPELNELTAVLREAQTSLDNIEGRMNPLGVPDNAIPFDISPGGGVPFATGADTHFEQVYKRAIGALNNAVLAFNDAKDVTRQMRTEQDSLTDFQAALDSQELAYKNALIELYGTPYPDDMGPGRTYTSDYDGPDLAHYMYVDLSHLDIPNTKIEDGDTIKIDIQGYPSDWNPTGSNPEDDFNFVVKSFREKTGTAYTEGDDFLEIHLDSHGFFDKPDTWTSRRASPGAIQQAISAIIIARNDALSALKIARAEKYTLDRKIEIFESWYQTKKSNRSIQRDHLQAESALAFAKFVNTMFEEGISLKKSAVDNANKVLQEALPDVFIAGFSNGGDFTFGAKAALVGAKAAMHSTFDTWKFVRKFALGAFETSVDETIRFEKHDKIGEADFEQDIREKIFDLDMQLDTVQGKLRAINGAFQKLDDAHRTYRAALAKGLRIQEEREIARKRSAAIVQGFRSRDAAFRIFRNEKLERYNTLFDLAAQYAFMAAKAYDYETGLLDTDAGRNFLERITQSRALGVVAGGSPQFAGSDNGDPGISSALAEMKADWNVLKGRLGLNNPDVYGTTFSLRTENFRIHPGSSGDVGWRQVLEQNRMSDLLQDADVRRYCLQIERGEGLAVPGIVIEFDTTIETGRNFFGELLGAGDNFFAQDSFAHKIGTVGIALEGYIGMSEMNANASTTGGASPATPSWSFLDPLALAATPHVYFVPVGLDAMRSPPLGDASGIRMWQVDDVTIPLPFNIGASDLSTQPFYRSGDSLIEPLFGIRKHRSFRPVDDASVFQGSNGRLFPSTYTNSRLIGRSVWNTRWKLIIPGHYLYSDPEEGLDRFIETVNDIKLHFETYSYAGN